jgi:tRNA (mo5U34)-methyltransferase
MRIEAPENFDIKDFFKGIYTFQQWELFPGHCTDGPKNVIDHMRRLQIPGRLDGLRVLDIAPWNGFFGFECARRGAAEVISLGPDDPGATGYSKTRELLQLENCRYVRASVYNLSPEVHGTFDVVLFLGLIYHLRHPLLALDRIYDVAEGRLFTDSPIIDRMVFDKTVTDQQREQILVQGKLIHELLPMVYYTKAAETGDDYNWFMPNKRAFNDFVESSGFKIDHYVDDGGGWASIAATKGKRSFNVGVEGWNEAAAKAKEAGSSVHTSTPASTARAAREELRRQLPHDQFIAALELSVSISEITFVGHPNFARALELINHSQQFTTAGKIWTLQECDAYFKSGHAFYAFRAKDRFADHGFVGCAVMAGNEIVQLVMNGGVIGLDIELAVIHALEGRMRDRGETEIVGQLVETEDNLICHDLYKKCGFELMGSSWKKTL